MFEPIEKVTPLLKSQGYEVNDPWDIVDIFEKKLAKFAGSKYAVSVDNCTDGMFLCLKYLNLCPGCQCIPVSINRFDR